MDTWPAALFDVPYPGRLADNTGFLLYDLQNLWEVYGYPFMASPWAEEDPGCGAIESTVDHLRTWLKEIPSSCQTEDFLMLPPGKHFWIYGWLHTHEDAWLGRPVRHEDIRDLLHYMEEVLEGRKKDKDKEK